MPEVSKEQVKDYIKNMTLMDAAALVKELAELLSANELTEIEVEDGGRKIRVKRDAAPIMAYAAAPAVV